MTEGILAIWNDCAPGDLDAYESWYRDEHLPERLAIPGIRRGRRYVSTGEGPGFFTYYEIDTPGVMSSGAYLEQLNNPTPRTRAMMSGTFLNMSRTICRVMARQGRMRGAWAVVQRLPAPPADGLGGLIRERGVARAEIWAAADPGAPSESTESRLRGGDDRIAACLFVETLRRADAELVQRQMPGSLVYRFLCELTAEAAPGPAG